MLIDKNNILCISDVLSKTKEYTQTTDGYVFSDYDKILLVLHKGEFREINMKDLGNNMSVIYIENRKTLEQKALDYQGFHLGLAYYDAFDQEKGDLYYFLPKISEKDIEKLNNIISKFSEIRLVKTSKGICLDKNMFDFKQQEKSLIEDVNQIISFLFAMTLLYGKLNIKDADLKSFKIHINLFGKYLGRQNLLDQMVGLLAKNGIFINTSIQKSNTGIVYQISSSDYELLKSFSNFYQSIENIKQISKYNEMLDVKSKLLNYIKAKDPDNKELLSKIEEGVVKILMK